jgi:hypothetical protein
LISGSWTEAPAVNNYYVVFFSPVLGSLVGKSGVTVIGSGASTSAWLDNTTVTISSLTGT